MCEIIIIIISVFFLILSNILAVSIIFVIYYTISFTISVGRCIDQRSAWQREENVRKSTNIFAWVLFLLSIQHSDELVFFHILLFSFLPLASSAHRPIWCECLVCSFALGSLHFRFGWCDGSQCPRNYYFFFFSIYFFMYKYIFLFVQPSTTNSYGKHCQ